MTTTADRATAYASAVAPRRLGAASVTAFGLGGAPLGGLYEAMSEQTAEAVLAEAWSAGIRYFDTAPLYGAGASERRLGRLLRSVPRDAFTVSTKVGRRLTPASDGSRRPEPDDLSIFPDVRGAGAVFDFSRDAVLRSLEGSLDRLGLDRVDVVYLHDPDDHWREAVEHAYPVLHELREQGVVRAIGAGMNQSAMLTRFVRETDLDAVLLAGRFTLLDRSAALDLLPACAERGVAVVAGGVLNSGLLARPEPGAMYDYAPAPSELVQRAERLSAVCAAHGCSLLSAALQFPGTSPVVASVVVGARSPAELATNLQAFETPVPEALWAELAQPSLLQRPA